MSGEDAEGSESASLDDGDLQDNIAHWLEVLDNWIRRIDRGMGRQDGEAASPDGAGASGPSTPSTEEHGAEPRAGADG